MKLCRSIDELVPTTLPKRIEVSRGDQGSLFNISEQCTTRSQHGLTFQEIQPALCKPTRPLSKRANYCERWPIVDDIQLPT